MDDGVRTSRSKLGLVAILGILSIAAAVSTATPAAASGIGVYVGYADSLRADPTNFPTPWAGSPNTVFDGCKPPKSCVFDAGAVRIVNGTANTVTVNSVAVHVSTCTFTGWDGTPLAPGEDLIVTQMAASASDSCSGSAELDTSDVGPGGSNYTGQCTPDGILPTVDVTVDGVTTSYTDSGQILNTGGFDAAACPSGSNESIQWTVIGTGPCPGSLLTLTPATQVDPVGSAAALTATFTNRSATLTNSCGQPLSNVVVNFGATSGPNAGVSGSDTTNASGQASFSYTSVVPGTDTWGAYIDNVVGRINSNTVTVTWTIAFAPGGGAFVIGDTEDRSNAPVYWWGAQWWKKNLLSIGSAPASFKGYEQSNLMPSCGGTWTTRPGNSSRPPKVVAANVDMAVIVASHITKKGSVISGDIVDIVVVHTNPGYGPNPGHPGTGTIVGSLCGSTHASQSVSPKRAKHGASPAVAFPVKSQGKPADAAQLASANAASTITPPAEKPQALGQIRKQLRRR